MLSLKHIWVVYFIMFVLSILSAQLCTYFGLIIPLIVFFDFINNLSKKIPIRELILATLSFQCLFSPFLFYMEFINASEIHFMAVNAHTYFSFMTPAFCALAVGVSFLKEDYYRIINFNSKKYYRIGVTLVILGSISDLIIAFVPGGLVFFVKLLIYTKFIGAYYLLFSEHKNYVAWIIFSFIIILITSIYSTVFQEFLSWGIFFILYLFYKKKFKKITQIAIISVLLIGTFILQGTKSDYRSSASNRGEFTYQKAFNSFTNQYIQTTTDDETFSDEGVSQSFVRFNQGYIISRILYHMPRYEPFARGKSIEEAIYGAFVPRILDPNKMKVGGGNGLYSQFTGYVLVGGTSMDLSVFGELYANYGSYGGILGCLILGLFYNLIITTILRYSRKMPHLIFWLPYVCLICARPENSFTPLMNHIFKSIMVLTMIYHLYLKTQTFEGKLVFFKLSSLKKSIAN